MGFLDKLVDSVAGGALGFLGSIGTSAQAASNSREQMKFQERMSSTAYQRAVKDMKASGLNPMLAYSQGGASAPMGSMPNVGDPVAAGISSAKTGAETKLAEQMLEQNKAQTDLLKAQAAKTMSETMDISVNSAEQIARINLTEAQERQVRALMGKTTAEAGIAGAEWQTRERVLHEMEKGGGFAADVRRKKAEALLAELGISEAQAMSKYYEGVGNINPYVRILLDIVKGASSARGAMR